MYCLQQSLCTTTFALRVQYNTKYNYIIKFLLACPEVAALSFVAIKS
jgi:hypothetical protein